MPTAYTIEQLKHVLVPIFQKNNINSAILFGSYSKGRATAHSDVDLLVDSGLHGPVFLVGVLLNRSKGMMRSPGNFSQA